MHLTNKITGENVYIFHSSIFRMQAPKTTDWLVHRHNLLLLRRCFSFLFSKSIFIFESFSLFLFCCCFELTLSDNSVSQVVLLWISVKKSSEQTTPSERLGKQSLKTCHLSLGIQFAHIIRNSKAFASFDT